MQPAKSATASIAHPASRSRYVRDLISAPEAEILSGIRHLSKLSNYQTSALAAQQLDVRALAPDDLFVVLRAMLSADRGVQADEHIEWFLRGELGGLIGPEQLALAKLLFASGLRPDRKVRAIEEAAAKLRVAGTLTPQARRAFRYQEYRVRVLNEDRVDTLQYAEMGKLDVERPGEQIAYFSYLRDRGYNDVVEAALGKLIRTHGAKNPAVLLATLKYNAVWAVTSHPELLAAPVSLLGRLDVMEAAYANRDAHQTLATWAEEGLRRQAKAYVTADIYAKDKILRTLLRMEKFDDCNALLNKDVGLSDLVLPALNFKGIKHLADGDYVAAKDVFGRVLEEDPSDSFAAQGMRFSLMRTGGNPKTILEVRNQIGYGISSAGRVGASTRIGSDQIIAHLNSGEYREGLYGKRHAAHWRLMKRVYGSKFLNYEFIPLKNAASRHIFVMGDEGVSDEVRTAQYYDFLVSRFQKVTISCDPRFMPIYQRTWPSVEFIPVQRHRKGVAKPTAPVKDRISNFDLKLSSYLTEECRPAMEAADYITFGQSVFFNHFTGRIPRPKPGPYLKFLPVQLPPTDKLRVGLQWRSGFVSTWRKFMYLELEAFAPLMDMEGVEIWSLQHEMTDEERAFCLAKNVRIPDGADLYNDFDAVASYTGAMDLMVGLSSFPIEMGCAVGTQAWMLGFSPENYYLRTSGGRDENDRLSLNSKVIAPSWIDFSAPLSECVALCIADVRDRLEQMVAAKTSTAN